jgi:hypothetical protein
MRRRTHDASKRPVGRLPSHPWFSIRVELVEGRGEHYWPRPGRLFAAASGHSFGQLATAIDDAFARWDRSHLHEFELADGTRIGMPDPELENEGVIDETRQKLSRLKTGQQFTYEFDLGDGWTHLCTVVEALLDPLDTIGLVPDAPLPYFGWGNIPDQYGRTWADMDGESPIPIDPELTDLPPLRPGWGPKAERSTRR